MSRDTIIDIAKRAGVSPATISRALNPIFSHLVKPETRDKIKKIVEESKYRPSEIARMLASGRSRYIGILLPIVSSSIFYTDYYAKFYAGLIDVIRDLSYRLHVVPLNIEKDRELCVRSVLENPTLEGIIVSPDIGDFYFPIERLVGHSVPSVVVSEYRSDLDLNFVYSDSHEGGSLVGKYIAEKGLGRAVMIKAKRALADINEREKGFKEALSKAQNVKCDKTIILNDLREKDGYEAGMKLLKGAKGGHPDVIFAANDELAIGLLRAIDKIGLNSPRDIKVIGYDGLDIGRYTKPTLTTVDQGVSEIAREGMKILIDRLEGKKTENIAKRIKPKLLERESC